MNNPYQTSQKNEPELLHLKAHLKFPRALDKWAQLQIQSQRADIQS